MSVQVAISVIGNFLLENEMMVYLVVFDQDSFELSEKLFASIAQYIDDNYIEARPIICNRPEVSRLLEEDSLEESLYASLEAPAPVAKRKRSLDDVVKQIDETFSQMLLRLIDEKGTTDAGGYNALLAKQTKEPGEAIVTTVLFDDKYELLHDRINIKGIAPITEKEYYVGGTTALLDAVGKTIDKIKSVQVHTAEDERAEQVMFVITTDGMENASCEFSYEKVRQMIEEQKTKYGWEFIFLGANIDAIATAERFGISKDRATNYNADSEGTLLNYAVVNETVSCLRACRSIPDNWKDRIEADVKRRGGRK